jgi:hypothetical protein
VPLLKVGGHHNAEEVIVAAEAILGRARGMFRSQKQKIVYPMKQP